MVFAKNDLITKSKQEFESDSVEIISLELTIARKKVDNFFILQTSKVKHC